MLLYSFTYSNPFRSVDVSTEAASDFRHEWTAAEIAANHYQLPTTVGFGTGQDVDYFISIESSRDESIPEGCYSAIVLPLDLDSGWVYFRGGYSDVDLPLSECYVAVGCYELPDNRIIVRLYTKKPTRLGVLLYEPDN